MVARLASCLCPAVGPTPAGSEALPSATHPLSPEAQPKPGLACLPTVPTPLPQACLVSSSSSERGWASNPPAYSATFHLLPGDDLECSRFGEGKESCSCPKAFTYTLPSAWITLPTVSSFPFRP